MTDITKSFQDDMIMVALERIAPTRLVSPSLRQTQKYRTILATIKDVDIIEPLAVYPDQNKVNGQRNYILLDGHLRYEALKELGKKKALCLISTDDESFTYNKKINRLTSIQENKMIVKAIERGVSADRIAKALDVNIKRIRAKQNMLRDIAPEVVEILKDKMVSVQVFSVLRKMKPMAQIETSEMMLSANRYTVTYAKALLAGMPQEKLVKAKNKKNIKGVSPEDIAKMEKEMERLQAAYRNIDENLGETIFSLVVTKGYLSKILENEEIESYLHRHHASTLDEIHAVIDKMGEEIQLN
ncbi:plasmid partitioning protein RepB C-terminal domain-containing protein [Terasakiella sp. SH-1]|uniref:plasmid partitioning protein RepB C-terminal domain-containing protein n=1 Tax=Terasakiella sp. SH-1 TaxID=2560057 RepID=UPI0010749D36|nr:plasmid partitioning protein RepB C-terminal domain-containing protein [Terasakiella sp. SH-1]